MRDKTWITIFLIGGFMYAFYYWATLPTFSADEIEQCRRSIREEYEKKPNIRVEDVTLVKENANKLTGFVKLSMSGSNMTIGCSAVKGDGHYIWSCR